MTVGSQEKPCADSGRGRRGAVLPSGGWASEGGGDGVCSPRAQADHLPWNRVQLLVGQAALLTCRGRHCVSK